MHVGVWGLAVIVIVIVSWLLYRYLAPQGWKEWARAGVVQAFIIAFYAEMYGFPLTIYRRGHRCRDRDRGHRARAEQPARRRRDPRALAEHLPQDDPEPPLGNRLQQCRHPARGRRGLHGGDHSHAGHGAVLMSLSTVIVAINARLLRMA
jgi:hypothetical protein